MLRDALIDIFQEIWPMLIIFSMVVFTLRLTYVLKYKTKVKLYEEIITLLFLVYVLCLFYVVTFQDSSWSTSNFIPFKEMLRYDFGTKMFFRNVVGNMIMFIPYGLFASYYLKLKKPYIIIGLSFLISITIEITQSIIGRVFDVDDILLNITGGFLGFLLYKLIVKIEQYLPSFLKKTLFYNILLIGVLIAVILYLFKIINLGV